MVKSASLRARWTVAEAQIITSDGADVGWMQSSIQDHALYLEQIFIDAASQRRGIGTAIIHGLIDQATRCRSRAAALRTAGIPLHQDDRKFYMPRNAATAD
jgi:GNAT superfamily N-acetyltransferase